MRATIAAHASWKNTADRKARTGPARRAAADRFERQVDPAGELCPKERAKRAEHAHKEHMTRLAFKSARARRDAAAR